MYFVGSVTRNYGMLWFWSLQRFLDETAHFIGKYVNLAVGYLLIKIFFTFMKVSFYFSGLQSINKGDISVVKEELFLP